jgi:hypothetical protein
VLGIFNIGSQELFAWGRLQTAILLISASQVAKIRGISYKCPALQLILNNKYIYLA